MSYPPSLCGGPGVVDTETPLPRSNLPHAHSTPVPESRARGTGHCMSSLVQPSALSTRIMSSLFQTDRSLLHPHFETYRLRSLDPEQDVVAYPLPNEGATQSRVKGGRLLSFKEMQSRVNWDHLCAGSGGRLVYVDEAYKVIGAKLNSALAPVFTELASLPIPISSEPTRSEYPSVLFLSDTAWAVTQGTGSLYVLTTSAADEAVFTGRVTAEYELGQATDADGPSAPFLLLSAHSDGDKSRILLSRLASSDTAKASEVAFELVEVEIPLVASAPKATLQPRWVLRGDDLPAWSAWHGQGWVVASGSDFKQVGVEQVDAKGATEEQATEPKVAPYSWTQTSTSLTVQIPLPPDFETSDLQCVLDAKSLSLSIKDQQQLQPRHAKLLDSMPKPWWDAIKVDDSTWTWQKSEGLLELELTKVHDGVRWPSLFSSRDDDDDDAEMSDSLSVNEIFTEEQMNAIRDNLSQFHTDASKVPESVLPGLLKEEMDDDDEDGGGVFGDRQDSQVKVGREVSIGTIIDGVPKWSKQSAWLLSTPVAPPGTTDASTLLIKAGVDAGLYAPGELAHRSWSHLSTSPALSYVLGSKRNTRSVVHTLRPDSNSATVLAFESGDATASANVFAFFPPTVTNAVSAQQGVVRVGGGERGSILGVKQVDVEGRRVIAALCEKALVLLPSLDE